jgi:hypothetical protein
VAGWLVGWRLRRGGWWGGACGGVVGPAPANPEGQPGQHRRAATQRGQAHLEEWVGWLDAPVVRVATWVAARWCLPGSVSGNKSRPPKSAMLAWRVSSAVLRRHAWGSRSRARSTTAGATPATGLPDRRATTESWSISGPGLTTIPLWLGAHPDTLSATGPGGPAWTPSGIRVESCCGAGARNEPCVESCCTRSAAIGRCKDPGSSPG